MRDGTRAFSQIQLQGIFHYFGAFKTEILLIYSLIGQILKQYYYPPQCRWPAVDIYRAALRLGKYPPLVTDTEGDNCILLLLLVLTYRPRVFRAFPLHVQ